MNTALIVAAQINDTVGGNFAAKVAAVYSVQDDGTTDCTGATNETCYGDWYLPSKGELNLLYAQKAVALFPQDEYYWSSTEVSHDGAWAQNFTTGTQLDVWKAQSFIKLRPVRAF